jgi:glycosyltransferase involved in cell wall biosynthesis
VAVVIPTYNRGHAVFRTLRRIYACDPPPDETWVHIDAADGSLESAIMTAFPEVHVLTSSDRVGPGGGRHRCLMSCSSRYAVSLDDDSYPFDLDFFSSVASIFDEHPEVALVDAQIWHRDEKEIVRGHRMWPTLKFTGCGHAVRVAAYRSTSGYLAEPVAYGVEENDLAMQLFARNLPLSRSETLRVFHDRDRSAHGNPQIVSGYISNMALLTFINYPVYLWALGIVHVFSVIRASIERRRFSGIARGLALIPAKLYRRRRDRRPLSGTQVIRFLLARRIDPITSA